MKVKKLIEQLQQMDGEMAVILQKDAEGNGYSPLEYTWSGLYIPETRWSGIVVQDDEDAKRVFILVPTN